MDTYASPLDKYPSLDLNIVSHMSEQEVLQFESVLNRNDELNTMEINRIRRLRSAVPVIPSSPVGPGPPPETQTQPLRTAFQRLVCQRCGTLSMPPGLALIRSSLSATTTTTVCRICRAILCRSCWGGSFDNRLKICATCYRKIVMDAKTGHWFHQQMKKRLPNQTSLQLESQVAADSVQSRQSPKRNLLRRLRSYNSVHEELSDGEDHYDEGQRMSGSNTPMCGSPLSPSFHVNSDGAEDHRDQLKPEGVVVASHRNYYRPLSHIITNPLKSSSNGSPVSDDEANLDIWKSITNDDIYDNNVHSLTTESGEVLVELDFNFRMSQFIVVLRQCRNLPPVDPCTKSICPYIFILLLPDRSRKSRRTTSVKKNSFCPIFDQIFKYSINFTELETRSLLVMLCHKDDHSTRDLVLGQVVISLSFLDFSKPLVRWYSFQMLNQGLIAQPMYDRRSISTVQQAQSKRSNIPPYLGEISLALKYVPRPSPNLVSPMVGELHVWIKSMRNLSLHQWATPASRRFSTNDTALQGDHEHNHIMNGLSSGSSRLLNAVAQLGQNPPVARVCILPYRTNSQSTEPARVQTDNGMQFTWSAILKFPSIELDELRTRSMEVTVWVTSRHGWLTKIIQSKCMGGVRLSRGSGLSADQGVGGVNSRGASTGLIEEKMWNAMLERPSTWIDGTARLKMESSFLTQ